MLLGYAGEGVTAHHGQQHRTCDRLRQLHPGSVADAALQHGQREQNNVGKISSRSHATNHMLVRLAGQTKVQLNYNNCNKDKLADLGYVTCSDQSYALPMPLSASPPAAAKAAPLA
jgi:hypothetical protein